MAKKIDPNSAVLIINAAVDGEGRLSFETQSLHGVGFDIIRKYKEQVRDELNRQLAVGPLICPFRSGHADPPGPAPAEWRWDDYTTALDNAPITYLPALLKQLMELNLRKSLRPGGVLKLATIVESDFNSTKET